MCSRREVRGYLPTCEALVGVCQEQGCQHGHKSVAGLRGALRKGFCWLLLLSWQWLEAIHSFLCLVLTCVHDSARLLGQAEGPAACPQHDADTAALRQHCQVDSAGIKSFVLAPNSAVNPP